LGSVLLANCLWKQVSTLPESAFALAPHRIIFRAISELADEGKPFDEWALAEELRGRGEIDAVGGEAYVSRLTDGVILRQDIRFMANNLLEAAARRTAAKTGEQLQHLADDRTISVTALAQTAASLASQCYEPLDALPPRHSEEALALRFSRRHADDLRYVARWGHWLRWDGRCWSEDQTLAVFDRARSICRLASAECTESEKNSAIRVAASSTVSAVERLARCDRRHAASPEQFDANPWLLNTPSGTVDLKTGSLHPSRREDYLTKLAVIGPGEGCPLWLEFLARVTGANTNLQSFLQRMIGYCLTGLTREQAIFFLYGSGANGKSVFLSSISGILGGFAKTAPMSMFTASATEQHPTELAGLRGARLVTAIETEAGSRWAESKIKSLTGGDRIAARFMRQDFFEFVPEFKLLVAGNHKPSLRSVDEAMRRRLYLIPFTVTIAESERDPALAEKLTGEYPGILRWAIEGCLAWQRQGLDAPDIVRDATQEYLSAEDAIGRWLDDRCDSTTSQWTDGASLFRDWASWCGANGEQAGNQKRLTQALEARGFRPHRTRNARGFSGIALRCISSVTRVTPQSVSDVTPARGRPI
jgi:putative DNA primase/helicase